MRIIQVHNFYLNPGGEDVVIDDERDLLESHGHTVFRFTLSNKEANVSGLKSAICTGLNTSWSWNSYKRAKKMFSEAKPDIVHVHNTFPLISPSIFWAAATLNIPTVLTLHNYRLMCANALLMRDGETCEKCVESSSLNALRYKCYRNSLAATSANVLMQLLHNILGTYQNKVGAFIVLSYFMKSLMERANLPSDRIYVKPNFIPDSIQLFNETLPTRENKIVFVGRISQEKGVDILLEAWEYLSQTTDNQLIIIGDGPERTFLEEKYKNCPNVSWRGWLSRKDALQEVGSSKYLVISSRWYEGLPMVILEALSLGTPVIAPQLAGIPESVRDGNNGFLFKPNNIKDLNRVLLKSLKTKEPGWSQMSRNARETYLADYTKERNYTILMEIYKKVLINIHSQELVKKTEA